VSFDLHEAKWRLSQRLTKSFSKYDLPPPVEDQTTFRDVIRAAGYRFLERNFGPYDDVEIDEVVTCAMYYCAGFRDGVAENIEVVALMLANRRESSGDG
jgi:hypothetical protein